MAKVLADAQLSEEEIESLTLAFLMYDLDGSGGIDVYELKLALQSMGQNPTEEEILELMGAIDEDGSGQIGPLLVPFPGARRRIRARALSFFLSASSPLPHPV